jgi:hypothetical protein
MSILDDISMGLGFKKPDDKYHERTAATIAKNQGQAAADRYTANNPPSGSSSDSGSTGLPKTATVRPVARPDVIERDATGKITGSSYSEGNKPTFEQLYPAVSSGRTDEYSSDFLTLPAAKQEGLSAMLTSAPQRVLGYLGGARSDDPIVNIIDGKPVYRDSEGRTYSYNALGMSYNTKDENTLEEDPEQVARREAMMGGMGSDDDGGTGIIDDLLENDSETTDPCPDGYVYDSEQMMCVIDPTTGLTPDLPSIELPDPTVPVSDYTQVAGNFIPTPLQPTAPNPIQQQLTQMNRMMRGPQQPQHVRELTGSSRRSIKRDLGAY